jgi:hypothetical protein
MVPCHVKCDTFHEERRERRSTQKKPKQRVAYHTRLIFIHYDHSIHLPIVYCQCLLSSVRVSYHLIDSIQLKMALSLLKHMVRGKYGESKWTPEDGAFFGG